MAEQSLQSTFPRTEFFALLPPGLFAFSTIYAAATLSPSDPQTLWQLLTHLSATLKANPVLIAFVILASYLLGSIFRALPVNLVERLIPPFRCRFPYPDTVHEVIADLRQHPELTLHAPAQLPDVGDTVSMHVFNYWKDILCIRSTAGFTYYQTFETRVRLFAGIFWAAIAGILSSIVAMFRVGAVSDPLGLALLVISIVLLVTFSANFARARRQEVRALVMLFAASQRDLPAKSGSETLDV